MELSRERRGCRSERLRRGGGHGREREVGGNPAGEDHAEENHAEGNHADGNHAEGNHAGEEEQDGVAEDKFLYVLRRILPTVMFGIPRVPN